MNNKRRLYFENRVRKLISSISIPLLTIIIVLIIAISIITYLKITHQVKGKNYEDLHKAINYIIDITNRVAGKNRTIELLSPSIIKIYNPFKDKSILECRVSLHDLELYKKYTFLIQEDFNKLHLPIVPIGKTEIFLTIKGKDFKLPIDLLGKNPYNKLWDSVFEKLPFNAQSKIEGGTMEINSMTIEGKSVKLKINNFTYRTNFNIIVQSINKTNAFISVSYYIEFYINYTPEFHGNINLYLVNVSSEEIIIKLSNTLTVNSTLSWYIDDTNIKTLAWSTNVTKLKTTQKTLLIRLWAITQNALLTKGFHKITLSIKIPNITTLTREIKIRI